MNVKQHWTRPETAAVAGLLASASGIAVLWAAGIEFPVYPPPGIVLLGTGAVAFAAVRTRVRWAFALPIVLGAFIQAGFMIEGFTGGVGFANLAGDAGTAAQIGQAVQQLGAVTAIVGGVLTLRARTARRTPQAV
ncbi:hypothetical protein ACFQS3_19715 [Glycomyces mayteni]|uniref:Uncharacterized protein n=1 Tax=Glycomyces mayteni TaxID=543887 RepID=A0ABW2DAP1_9ACTN|nr:hypothetical protein GCM10025732_04440 [Glycomyces mayteni]